MIFLLCPDTRNLRVKWGCTFFLYMIVRVYVFLLPTAHTDCSIGSFINLCNWRILPIMHFPDTMVRTQSAQCTYTVRECWQKIFNVPKYRQRVSLYVSLCCQKNHLVSALFVHFSFLKKCAVVIISVHLAVTQPWLFPVPHLTVGDVSEEGWG